MQFQRKYDDNGILEVNRSLWNIEYRDIVSRIQTRLRIMKSCEEVDDSVVRQHLELMAFSGS